MNLLVESFLRAQQEMTGHMLIKENKDDAGYTIIPHPRQKCRDCIFFTPATGSNPPAGTSEKVWGIVDEEGHCDNFVSKYPLRKQVRP